ncbi:hypothetical protein OGAPHI_006839 [Ogataea philodendri]|uniref:Transcription factor domain-containing protein n=1 Tax=Ogataea philodendri TaxID=1378263 RepID=A0A9P8NXU2_9ASCO|nr:uncharacterized protein OGAPHI_006839 [Ogataea philodendri]KAH3661432.1 hypothetical protein OGAPHI_006839 [Ogataea philodendri]
MDNGNSDLVEFTKSVTAALTSLGERMASIESRLNADVQQSCPANSRLLYEQEDRTYYEDEDHGHFDHHHPSLVESFPSSMKRARVEIQTISLQGTPMGTVQSACDTTGATSQKSRSTSQPASLLRSPLNLLNQLNQGPDYWCCDPIALGMITSAEAQRLVDAYFEKMHCMAPLLTQSLYSNAENLRKASTQLFLTVCCVGARGLPASDTPRIYDMAALLDFSLGQVVHGARTGDITLELLESLQIYAHWMPLRNGAAARRYNEVSVWNVIGLAIRWAKFMDLEGKLAAAFGTNGNEWNYKKSVSRTEDLRILRIMLNLLSLDYQTMLSTRLRATIDPNPLLPLARRLCASKDCQPDDHRLLGLCELTNALKYPTDLHYINFFLDQWAVEWSKYPRTDAITPSPSEMPFTSQRWYRLSLNSIPLAGLCSGASVEEAEEHTILTALKYSVESATDMFACFFVGGRPASAAQWNNVALDMPLLARFKYAIDSYWMTHTFAFVLLCILYARGAIDDMLFCHIPSQIDRATGPPSQSSPLAKLLQVGLEVFTQVGHNHPAAHLGNLVAKVFESISMIDSNTNYVEDVFPIPLDDGFDLGLYLAQQS